MTATYWALICSSIAAGVLAVQTSVTTAIRAIDGPVIEGSAVYSVPVYAGESIVVPWSIKKRTDCPGVVSRVWRGEDGFYLSEPHRRAALPKTDDPTRYDIETKVPDMAPVGDLSLFIVGEYECDEPRPFEIGPVVFDVVPAGGIEEQIQAITGEDG